MIGMSPRQRRVLLIVLVLGGGAGAIFGFLTEGVGLAIGEAGGFLVVGAVVFWVGPLAKPPPPRILPKPILGSSRAAIRKRRVERLVSVFISLPLVLAAVGLALVAPTPGARFAAGGVALALVSLYGFLLWRAGGTSEAADRRRLRLHQRQVERMTEERRWYEEHADPELTRRRMLLLVKIFVWGFVVSGLLVVVALPGAITEHSDSPGLRTAGGVGSALLAVGLLVGLVAVARRRS